MDSEKQEESSKSPCTSKISAENDAEAAMSSNENPLKRKIDDLIDDKDEVKVTDDDNDNNDHEDQDGQDEVDFQTLCCSWNEQIEEVETVTGLFGNSDENNCTYIDDDLARQPLYSCNTCEMKMNLDSKSSEKHLAGICFACAENCHKGHELFELYTKRNFRCDCGNEKFVDLKCKLFDKIGQNETNVYNHNFKGLYCTCELPYPCDFFDDTMLQCGICEDWYHESHLGVKPLKGYSDMICMNCVKRFKFLVYYQLDNKFHFNECDDKEFLDKELEEFCENLQELLAKKKLSIENDENNSCILDTIKFKYPTRITDEDCHTLYLPIDWRLRICHCQKCMQMYSEMNIEFITNPNDMFAIYVYRNQQKVIEKERSSTRLNRTQEIIVAEGIEHFKRELVKFLEHKSETCKTISAEDVAEFQKNLNAKKRQHIKYYCH